MSDQPPNQHLVTPPYGLRPETWAIAEYDGLREALNSVLARIISLEYRVERALRGDDLDPASRSAGEAVLGDLRGWHRDGITALKAKYDRALLKGVIAAALIALSTLEPRVECFTTAQVEAGGFDLNVSNF